AAGRENVSAVAESGAAEPAVADQLTCEANRNGATARCDEHDRTRSAVDELLQVRAGGYRPPLAPFVEAVAPPGGGAPPQPTTGGRGSGGWGLGGSAERHGRLAHLRHGKAAPTERSRQNPRVADAAENLARVSPQRASFSKQVDGVGMVLEVRGVCDRVTRD